MHAHSLTGGRACRHHDLVPRQPVLRRQLGLQRGYLRAQRGRVRRGRARRHGSHRAWQRGALTRAVESTEVMWVWNGSLRQQADKRAGAGCGQARRRGAPAPAGRGTARTRTRARPVRAPLPPPAQPQAAPSAPPLQVHQASRFVSQGESDVYRAAREGEAEQPGVRRVAALQGSVRALRQGEDIASAGHQLLGLHYNRRVSGLHAL